MLKLLGYGREREPRQRRKGKRAGLPKNPLPVSAIQQMKDIAGMPDMPNREFVAWFKRAFSLLENIHLAGAAAHGIQQPITPIVSTNGEAPPPAA